jgi:hypothetical protein
VAAGTDGKVVLYDGNGTVQQQFNYGADEVSLHSLSRLLNASRFRKVCPAFWSLLYASFFPWACCDETFGLRDMNEGQFESCLYLGDWTIKCSAVSEAVYVVQSPRFPGQKPVGRL